MSKENNNAEKYVGALSTGRLVVGIISLVLSVIILFQSCAAGFVNTVEDNGESGGSAGLFLAICMLVAGIVGIATRNSKGKAGAVVSAVFYVVGAILAFANAGSYGDLIIWAVVAILFAVIYIISIIKTK